MDNIETVPETRLSVRLKGALAAHTNQQIETLYESHSEYIRDLIRKDMLAKSHEDSQEISDTITDNALKSIEEDVYFEATDAFWNSMSARNRNRMPS